MAGNLIHVEQLDNALAALTSITRAMVQAELEKALKDTCDEAQQSMDLSVAAKLTTEANGIRMVLGCANRVSREYDDITQSK